MQLININNIYRYIFFFLLKSWNGIICSCSSYCVTRRRFIDVPLVTQNIMKLPRFFLYIASTWKFTAYFSDVPWQGCKTDYLTKGPRHSVPVDAKQPGFCIRDSPLRKEERENEVNGMQKKMGRDKYHIVHDRGYTEWRKLPFHSEENRWCDAANITNLLRKVNFSRAWMRE